MDTMQYYFGPTVDAINKIKGIDFIIGRNGEEFPSGKADQTNNIAYSCGLNEYYPHELIHLILHKRYKNSHGWFNEGVATYFGMSRGKPLEWHLKKVNTYLLSHPEINLNNLLELSNLDGETTFVYALGGFMVQLAYEKGGYELIKKLLLSGNTENDFYSACKTYFYIERNELNTYIRNELKKRFGS
jgi:hypothetical protein